MSKENKAKVRVFFGEIEGDNETIRDGLKSIAAAVNKTFTTESRIVRVLTSKTNDAGVEEFEENPALEAEVIESSEADSADKKPKKNRKGPTYSFVKDLNLMPAGQQSLREFYEAKKPNSQPEQLGVILYYLTKILSIKNVGSNHLYTAYKDVGVSVPVDIGHAARSTANRKGWIDSASSADLKMTVAGENFIEHKMPSKQRVSKKE